MDVNFYEEKPLVALPIAMQEYAETKIGIKILEDKIDGLKPIIIEGIKSNNHNLKNNLGTFYTTERTIYEYDLKTTARIKKLQDKIKEIQDKAISSGKVNTKEVTTLFFKARVEREAE